MSQGVTHDGLQACEAGCMPVNAQGALSLASEQIALWVSGVHTDHVTDSNQQHKRLSKYAESRLAAVQLPT